MRAYFRYSESDYFEPLTAKKIRRVFRSICIEEGKVIRRAFTHVQSHFSINNRTKVRRKTTSSREDGGTILTAVGTDKRYGSVLIWLEDGTEKRWRKMSYNWKSKTRGGLTFGPGAGHATGFKNFPYPGIRARNFRDAIIDNRYDKFIRNADREITNMWERAGWL